MNVHDYHRQQQQAAAAAAATWQEYRFDDSYNDNMLPAVFDAVMNQLLLGFTDGTHSFITLLKLIKTDEAKT